MLGQQEFAQNWAVNGIGSYNFGPKAYWARGRLLYKVFGKAWAGVELIKHGDPFYHATQGGLVLTGISVAKDLNLGFFGGAKKTAGIPRAIYGGFELSKAFNAKMRSSRAGLFRKTTTAIRSASANDNAKP